MKPVLRSSGTPLPGSLSLLGNLLAARGPHRHSSRSLIATAGGAVHLRGWVILGRHPWGSGQGAAWPVRPPGQAPGPSVVPHPDFSPCDRGCRAPARKARGLDSELLRNLTPLPPCTCLHLPAADRMAAPLTWAGSWGCGAEQQARAGHGDGIETVHACPFAQGSGAGLGAAEGAGCRRFLVSHEADLPGLCRRMSRYVHQSRGSRHRMVSFLPPFLR